MKDTSNRIQQYLDGSLNEQEEEAVLMLLLKQHQKNEFKSHWKAQFRKNFSSTAPPEALINSAMPNISKHTGTNAHSNSNLVSLLRATIAVCAVALFICFLSPYLTFQSPNKLAYQYWQETSVRLEGRRGGDLAPAQAEQVTMTNAIELFEQRQYQAAFNAFLPLSTHNEKATLLAGICAVELKQHEQSITLFQQVLDMPNATSKDQAKWRLALVYVMEKEYAQAREILQDIVHNNQWKHEQADKLLQALPSSN